MSSTPTASSWFGLFPVRSPLLGKSMFLSLPSGTQMFQFPEFPLQHYEFMLQYYGFTIVRFRIRIPTDNCSFQLPVAFRSQLRPSSAFSAKAFSICSLQLDRLFVPLINVLWQNYKFEIEKYIAYANYSSRICILNKVCSCHCSYYIKKWLKPL